MKKRKNEEREKEREKVRAVSLSKEKFANFVACKKLHRRKNNREYKSLGANKELEVLHKKTMYTNIEKERKNNKKSSDFLGKLKSISPGSLKNSLYPVYPNHHKKFAKVSKIF